MSDVFLGWASLLIGAIGIAGAWLRPIGRHSQRAAYAAGAGIGLLGVARLVAATGPIRSWLAIVSAGLLLLAIVSLVLSLKRREAFRAREPS